MNLSDKALIIRVESSAWTARRFDRQSTDELTASAGATKTAARVNTYLMAGADSELRAIHQIIREMRDFIDENSVPWDTNGRRLVTPQAYVQMLPAISRLNDRFAAAVRSFVTNYPQNVSKARVNLSDLSSRVEYPPALQVALLFSLRVVPEALPLSSPNDPRFGMTEVELTHLRTIIEADVHERLADSLMAQWKRLRDEVARLNSAVAPRDGGKRAPVFETTVEKLRNTAQVLAQMNITDDPHISAICGEVMDALHGVGVDTLRNSQMQREAVHDATSDILKKLEGLIA